MIRAAVYARFSSDKQNERSIDDQVALCRVLAERAGYTVVKVYADRAISGASTVNRLEFLQLMRDAKRGLFDVVVTEDVDRISRDQADFHTARKQLKFNGITIHAAHGPVDEIEGSVRAMIGEIYLQNLAQKTRRGQAGVVRDGRHAGGRSYGYRAVKSQPGRLVINEDEASVVRRIFAEYLEGRSPREIARRLNREKIPGPRGRVWNASTIAGSRKRRNGVLQNALYAGRIVWNRQRFIKDPDTGRRVSRPNPESEWMTAKAPDLRIIEQAVFESAQARKAARGGERAQRARPRHLLSGLLKCGCCGSGYIVVSKDKRGTVVGCSRVRETGLCDNHRTLSLKAIEARVIEGIEKHLAAPDLIAEFVREFHRHWRELRDTEANRRRALERELAEVSHAIKKVIDVLIADTPTRALRDRLVELEAKRDALERDLADVPPPAYDLHPNLAATYRRQIADLKVTLASMDEERRDEAFEKIRALVEKIVIHPRGAYKPADIEIHGRLAALLRISEGAAVTESVVSMVAGVGFEPTTFRL